jgi:hypothetical protein
MEATMKTQLWRIKVGMVTLALLALVALSMVAMQASVLVTLGRAIQNIR